MLLDLDKGTLTVYTNGRRLGAMTSKLSGEYCWFTYTSRRVDTVSTKRGVLYLNIYAANYILRHNNNKIDACIIL